VRNVIVKKAAYIPMTTKECLLILAVWMEEALIFNDIDQYSRLQMLKSILLQAQENEN